MVANGTSVDPSQHELNQHCAIASNAAALPPLLVHEGATRRPRAVGKTAPVGLARLIVLVRLRATSDRYQTNLMAAELPVARGRRDARP
jgi:hypothetical protein